MEKVVMLIWQFRDDPSVITFMARFIAKYSGIQHVLDGIEFYLPQLAHMIIHLEVNWDDAILERFVLVIAQQSIHFALQLNWILQGALQDYQPELEGNVPNPNYNPIFYTRCLKLLKNLELCVVYGKPRAQELQRLYEQGDITKTELELMEQADRRFNALQITSEEFSPSADLDGTMQVLLCDEKQSKAFFCVLDRHVLNLYRANEGGCQCSAIFKLDRALALSGASIEAAETKNGIVVKLPEYSFQLQCSSKEEQTVWMRRLKEEAHTTGLFQDPKLRADLTEAQLDRYDLFQHERQFVTSLTDLAEELRDKTKEERKSLAPKLVSQISIPDIVYLPLCNSSDLWRRTCCTVPDQTRVFNTKERCPVIMYFLSRRGETLKQSAPTDPNLDVAEFLHRYFHVSSPLDSLDEEKNLEAPPKMDDLKQSEHGSGAWTTEEDAEAPPPTPSSESRAHGNTKVQRLLRENVVTIPSKLAKRLSMRDKLQRRISVMDRQTEMQSSVQILNHDNDADNASVGDGTVVSVERSSVLCKDRIVYGGLDEGGIDLESIDRAKQFVCHGQSWAEKSAMLLEREKQKEAVPPGVQLEIVACMSKSNDDLRQEVFVMQMIHYYKSLFVQAKLPIWLKTYRILSTSSSEGLIEVLMDATSLDGLKKSEGYPEKGGLREYFELVYGGPDSDAFKEAQTNFMQSLVGYALVSYLLGLKDRHNGNIMIDTRGHLIHIDFGFALGMAPGHEFGFERAPFKLTKEYVEVMGGIKSDCYKEFERLFVAGFELCRKNSQIALGLVEIMMYQSNYPCFSGWRYGKGRALKGFEKRLMLKVPDKNVKRRALRLVRKSRRHAGTHLYDAFQKATNGYAI